MRFAPEGLLVSLLRLFPSGVWSRSAEGVEGVVVFVPCSGCPPFGLAPGLRAAGAVLAGARPLPGGVALLFRCPRSVRVWLLALPRPRGAGSRGAGVSLPW